MYSLSSLGSRRRVLATTEETSSVSRASDFAALAAQMKFTDSEGDVIAQAWIEEATVYVKLIGVDKLSCEEALKLGRWLVATTEEA